MSGRSCCYSKEVKSELKVGIDREGMEVRRRRRTWWEGGRVERAEMGGARRRRERRGRNV